MRSSLVFSFDSSIDETYLGGVAVIFSREGHNVKDNEVLKKKGRKERPVVVRTPIHWK